MNKVLFLGNADNLMTIESTTIEGVLSFLSKTNTIALDTETNVTDSILDRKLKVISIGIPEITTYIVIEWEFLGRKSQRELGRMLEDKLCIIHNVTFDFQILNKFGIHLRKTRCTFTQELILTTGLEKLGPYHGLASTYLRRFDLNISKAEQTSFGENEPLTASQIKYAAIDVFRLVELDIQQRKEAKMHDKEITKNQKRGTIRTMWWDNEFLKVVSDAETTGVRIDRNKWYDIEDTIKPSFNKRTSELKQEFMKSHSDFAYERGYAFREDTIVKEMWNSSKLKLELLQTMYPTIEKVSMGDLRKFLKANDKDYPVDLPLSGVKYARSKYANSFKGEFSLIKVLALRTKENIKKIDAFLNNYLKKEKRSWAIANDVIVAKNDPTISWSSNVDKLAFFQYLDPTLENTQKVSIENIDADDSIVHTYLEWSKYNYRLNNFGRNFYDKHVELDGKHRTRFNTVLSTGRLSSVKPKNWGL